MGWVCAASRWSTSPDAAAVTATQSTLPNPSPTSRTAMTEGRRPRPSTTNGRTARRVRTTARSAISSARDASWDVHSAARFACRRPPHGVCAHGRAAATDSAQVSFADAVKIVCLMRSPPLLTQVRHRPGRLTPRPPPALLGNRGLCLLAVRDPAVTTARWTSWRGHPTTQQIAPSSVHVRGARCGSGTTSSKPAHAGRL